jgi:hypothetical protein
MTLTGGGAGDPAAGGPLSTLGPGVHPRQRTRRRLVRRPLEADSVAPGSLTLPAHVGAGLWTRRARPRSVRAGLAAARRSS